MKKPTAAKLGLLQICLSLFLACFAHGDPTEPFAQPIADQLNADIAALSALPEPTGEQQQELNAYRNALRIYQRPSRNPGGDLGILQSLNALLAFSPTYASLISDVAGAYLASLEQQTESLRQQLTTNAPLSSFYFVAWTSITNVTNTLVRAAGAGSTAQRLTLLRLAARRVVSVPAKVERAVKASVGLSSVSVIGRVGVLRFRSGPGMVIGAFTNGVLDVAAIDPGTVVRGIHLHVENIDLNSARTYELGVGSNTGYYVGADVARKRDYFFRADPALSTNVPAQLTIEAVTSRFVVGQFSFVGNNFSPQPTNIPNRTVTVIGRFQLNF